ATFGVSTKQTAYLCSVHTELGESQSCQDVVCDWVTQAIAEDDSNRLLTVIPYSKTPPPNAAPGSPASSPRAYAQVQAGQPELRTSSHSAQLAQLSMGKFRIYLVP